MLQARVIRVPQDYISIKSAVASASDGDVVEVDDGIYFEKNIIVYKNITIKARNPLGVVIYGSGYGDYSVFVIRAEATIEGFILKNADNGITQRGGPDVLWRGRDLVFMNMSHSAVSLNDAGLNRGSAVLENIIIADCLMGIITNDARCMEVRNSLLVDCQEAFAGSNHLGFRVSRSATLGCEHVVRSALSNPKPPGTNLIQIAPDVISLDSFLGGPQNRDLSKYVKGHLGGASFERSPNGNLRARKEALIDELIGEALLQAGQLTGARAAFSRALEAASQAGFKDMAVNPLLGMAQIEHERGFGKKALEHYLKAIDAIDLALEGLPVWFYKPNYFADKLGLYEKALALLYELDREFPDEAYGQEAFRIAERTKSAGLFPAVVEFNLLKSEGLIGTDLTKADRAIHSRITGIQIDLLREMAAGEQRALLEELESAEDESIALLLRIIKQGRDRAELPYPKIIGLAEIQASLLGQDTAIIEYFWGSQSLYAFYLSRKALRFIRIAESGDLAPLIQNYLPFIAFNRPEEFRGAAGSLELFKILIGPFESDLKRGVKKIIVIRDGILHYLPFETLIRNCDSPLPPGQERDGPRQRYLIQDCEISYARSASSLARMSPTPEPRAQSRDILAVSGRPGARYGRQFPMRALNQANLAYADKEVRSIAGLFRSDMALQLGGEGGGESGLKALPLHEFKIIHFATHGLFNDTNWLRSALLLGEDPQKGEDGLLQPLEVFLLDLNADLVTLSACRSGDGLAESGGGLLGLSFPFLLAGARSVLTALWPIDDYATSEFMKRFYSHLMEGLSKGNALRATKMDMLDTKFRHPYFWAPFVLSGDSASSIKFNSKK